MNHPIEEKLANIIDKHIKGKMVDPFNAEYSKKLNTKTTVLPPKMSEWMHKEVMLPILGKNKTALLHTIDQFDLDGISNQKPHVNIPRHQYRGFQKSAAEVLKKSFQTKSKSTAPKKLTQLLK